MEVSLESSFQPTIQLYVIFPVLYSQFNNSTFTLTLFKFCKNENSNMVSMNINQTISIVTSILSLGTNFIQCFNYSHAYFHCKFYYFFSLVLYVISCHFEEGSLRQGFGSPVLQRYVVNPSALSS